MTIGEFAYQAAGLLLAYYIGWVRAHYTVAAECERLGGFYVGSKTFRCVKAEDSKE
ncbi:hypothetical protein [Pseudomonas monteilii]|jgi:hypothetical protein|uniref:hypothetical protein n=1 Tax=Pseudomonas monteilii TaxID=76759 RepID=UPI0018D5F5C5|nr:hypothetical protein [Pseudomonas monteilii]MBH3395825.1 hypothetical protein [Pseudomonas monteilii]